MHLIPMSRTEKLMQVVEQQVFFVKGTGLVRYAAKFHLNGKTTWHWWPEDEDLPRGWVSRPAGRSSVSVGYTPIMARQSRRVFAESGVKDRPPRGLLVSLRTLRDRLMGRHIALDTRNHCRVAYSS